MTVNANRILILVALLLFLVASVGIGSLGPFALVPLGLAVYMAAQLV